MTQQSEIKLEFEPMRRTTLIGSVIAFAVAIVFLAAALPGLAATNSAAPTPAAATPAITSDTADTPDSPTAPISCGNGVPGGVNCLTSKKDIKLAYDAFQRGEKLRNQNHIEDAFTQFDRAARLAPNDLEFRTARDLVKAQLVFNHVHRGNDLMFQFLNAQAAVEFRAALDLDPDNTFARERLADATRDSSNKPPLELPNLGLAGEIHLEPKGERASFHYRGDTRGLYNEIAKVYGVTAQFDDSVTARQVRFFVDDVDFLNAVRLAGQATKTMWTALNSQEFFVAADTPENHKQFDRMLFQSFPVPPHSSPQEMTDVFNTLRVILDIKFMTSGQNGNTIDVRAPAPVLRACAALLPQLSYHPPQVAIDVSVYEIDHQLMRNIGMHIPNTFNLYNIPAAAIAGLIGSLAGGNISSLINQLISSGGINQAGSSALSGLLAQLQGGGASSIFSTPLATFGGGLTFMGLSLDQLAANLSVNESWARSLEDITLRTGHNVDATLHIGERYPIENASYAPIYNSPQIASVIGNQSYVPPVPSVSYEDLGLNLKLKPLVQSNGTVTLQVDLEVRSLTGTSNNGIPVISNREYKGWINLKDGESAVVAGEVDQSDTRAMTGIPGLSAIPILNRILADNTNQEADDELMIIFTPHIDAATVRTAPEIWLSEK